VSVPIIGGAAGESHLHALTAPVAVRSVDISGGFTAITLPLARSGGPYDGLAVLAWEGDEPIGWLGIQVPPAGAVTGDALERACREQLAPRMVGEGGRPEPWWSGGSMGTPAAAAHVSHVVTTCNQASLAVRCSESIIACESGPFEIVVVENRPAGSTVRDAIVSAFPGDERVRFVAEPIPGLSLARNAGLRASRGEIVAFTDDDIVVDRHWGASVRDAFYRCPEASCVTGPILPAELETPSQMLMERFATLGKGFTRRFYTLDRPAEPEQPLFPYTAGYFGSGGNAAFRRDALIALGGFDPALGAGTPARGGEDLDMFIRVLLAGRGLLYEPGAVVWHPHPDTMELLSSEIFGYGVGLGAMLTRQVVAGPQRLRLIGKIPQGLHYLASSSSRKNANKGSGYPSRLDRLEQMGLALGPAAYASSRWRARRNGAALSRP
jgi:O-antigen biosynthesis protein